jgi:glucose/arabinose dehydrogenase
LKTKLLIPAFAVLFSYATGFAAFVEIDSFEGYIAGSAINNQDDWTSESSQIKVAVDPANSANKVLLVASPGGDTFRTYNDNPALSIANGTTGTLFTRFHMASGLMNVNFGLSDVAAPGSNTFNDFESQVRTLDGLLDARDGGGFQSLSGGGTSVDNADIWYQLWMVANNDSDTVTLYIQSDDDPAFTTQTELFSAAPPTSFRFGTTDALASLYIVINTSGADVYFDDFWIDTTGANLVNPIGGDAPVTAVLDDIEVGIGGSLAFNPTENDTGGIDSSSITIVSLPSQGSVDISNGRVTYKHTGGVAGVDSFRYSISNRADTSNDEANVSVTISGHLRLANTTVAVPLDPPSAPAGQLIVKNGLPGLSFPDAVAMATVPGSPKALMIASINGSIWYIPDTTSPTPTSHRVLDVSSQSNFTNGRSIYSFTCFPDFATSGNIVVNYQGDTSRLPVPGNGETIYDVIPNLDRDGAPDPTINTDLRVSRFTLSAEHIADVVANSMSGSENQAALDTEFPYINLAEQNTIHTVLDCKFGPDGYLFITFGDEGGQPDPHRNGQRISKDYFGSLLRIDVDPGSTNPKPNPHYTIPAGPLNNGTFPFFTDADSQEPNFRVPADNPFIHTSLGGTWNGNFNGTDLSGQLDTVRTEIWAMGLRTPFRFHLDTEDETGETEAWIGDVGYESWEEINLFKKGDNGGWSYYEGPIRTPGVTHASMPSGTTPNKPALWSYETEGINGNSVTGGIFYRGNTLPSLTNTYICGDYGSGRIFNITRAGEATELSELRLGGNDIVDFELDAETGEILVLEHSASGRVMRITEETNPPANFPLTLSDTGVFADLSDLSPNPGVVPYTPNLKFWSDDADKSRWFVIPNLTDTIGYSLNNPWTFPEGMVWIKHFDFDLDRSNPGTDIQRLETRLLVRNATGSYGVSYCWRNDGTEADLADNVGEEFEINFTDAEGQPDSFTWRIPSRTECLTCHNPEADHALSLSTRQFNLDNTIHGQTGNLITLLSDAGYTVAR